MCSARIGTVLLALIAAVPAAVSLGVDPVPAGPKGAASATPDDEDAVAIADAGFTAFGRDCTQRFYDRELESLWEEFVPRMKAVFGSVEQLSAFRDTVEEQMGAEQELYSEEILHQDGYRNYRRVARFEKTEQLVQVIWSLGEDLSIEGFRITLVQLEALSEYFDYETRAQMRLPFEGEWFVYWGGRTVSQNYHAMTRDQRFAYDILAMKDDKTHAGEGTRNEDYYAFGRNLFAPADGKVVEAGDGVADNVPGVMNPWQILGNYVILDHGNDEYTFMAHFKLDTVAVETGDVVKAGDFLGLCGNSGNSSEPHLHIHMQDSPVLLTGKGKPLPFNGYVADGKAVERGEPLKGQRIRPESGGE